MHNYYSHSNWIQYFYHMRATGWIMCVWGFAGAQAPISLPWALHHMQELPPGTGDMSKSCQISAQVCASLCLKIMLITGNAGQCAENLLCKNITALPSAVLQGSSCPLKTGLSSGFLGWEKPKASSEGSYRRFNISTQSRMKCQARVRVFCLSRITPLVFNIYNKSSRGKPPF